MMRDNGERSPANSEVPLVASPALRLAVYAGSIMVLLAAVRVDPLGPVVALLLGVIYAHGLELQHEALHGLLLSSERGNRLAGSLLGLPMLTTFTDTRIRHLHHHRCAGTERDVFDRSCADFSTLATTLAHVFSVRRPVEFVTTTFALVSGRPDRLLKARAYAHARTEFAVTALTLSIVLALAALTDWRLLIWGWLVPALIVAPPAHFLMTAAEHLGRPRHSPRPEDNARSYHAPLWWNYLVNYDNYHIEHHLRPALPFHRLPALHAERCRLRGIATLNYREAIAAVMHGIGDCLRSSRLEAKPPCAR